MPVDDNGDGAPEHKGHLSPFTPSKFDWNQDNLYEQFKASSMLWSLHSKDNMRTA